MHLDHQVTVHQMQMETLNGVYDGDCVVAGVVVVVDYGGGGVDGLGEGKMELHCCYPLVVGVAAVVVVVVAVHHHPHHQQLLPPWQQQEQHWQQKVVLDPIASTLWLQSVTQRYYYYSYYSKR